MTNTDKIHKASARVRIARKAAGATKTPAALRAVRAAEERHALAINAVNAGIGATPPVLAGGELEW